MDTRKFDVMLDISDKDFVEKLTKALGVKHGDQVTFITPQFDRVDGRAITYQPNTKEEYEALKNLDSETLKKIGCQVWGKEGGNVIWLFPHEWYDYIPNGTEVVDINGDREFFKHGVIDDDMRFGALSFGFTTVEH